MLISENELRQLIRETIFEDTQDAIMPLYKEYKGVIDNVVATAKLHPLIDTAFDVGELSADLYDIAKSAPTVSNIKNLSKTERKKMQKEQIDKIMNLVAQRLIDFAIDKLVLGQINKLDAVLQISFDTDTETVLKVALSSEFRNSVIAVFGDLFKQLGKIPDKVISDMEKSMTNVYNNAIASFKTTDKDKYANVTKMARRYKQ